MWLGSRTQRVGMFVLAGWLFADLFIGLAVLFMVGNTQNIPIIQPTPTATESPTATLPPSPTPTPQPPLSIDPHDLNLYFTVNDPYAIISDDPASVRQLMREISSEVAAHHDSQRRVALVLVYSGTDSGLARAVAAGLPSAGVGFKSSIYKEFFNQGQSVTALSLDIFFYR